MKDIDGSYYTNPKEFVLVRLIVKRMDEFLDRRYMEWQSIYQRSNRLKMH